MNGADAHARRARLERVASEAARLDRITRAWLARRRKHDVRQLHRARLDALEGALLGAAARIAAVTPALDLPTGALYRAAAAQERRLALVDRLFGFFRTRFDQRDTEPLGALLDSADEVIRSLYWQPFRAVNAPLPAPPLAYVEAAFSPRAIPRDKPPSELKGDDDVLRAALDRLPFGVVGVPAWFEEGPWTLVYLAHELGHHVQFDLAFGHLASGGLPAGGLAGGLVQGTAAALKQAAAGLGDGGRSFEVWSKEIFADAFSIAMIGPAAIEAMAELERGDDAAMLSPNSPSYPYPCPALRLALMAAFARAVGLDPAGALGGIDPAALAGLELAAEARSEPQRKLAAQLAVVPAVAAALAALPLDAGALEAWALDPSHLSGKRTYHPVPFVGLSPEGRWLVTLAEVCGLRAADFAPGGEVAAWAGALLTGKTRPRNATLRGTRLVLAASWSAWRRACAVADTAARTATLATLRETTSRALAENREPATLADLTGSLSTAGLIALGKDLGDFLLARSPEELGL